MLQAEYETKPQEVLLRRLMELPNQRWTSHIAQTQQNMAYLQSPEVMKEQFSCDYNYTTSNLILVPAPALTLNPVKGYTEHLENKCESVSSNAVQVPPPYLGRYSCVITDASSDPEPFPPLSLP